MQALPTESKIDPKNPIANSLLLNSSTSFQYHDIPKIIIKMLLKHEVENETVIASNPTGSEVKCLINNPDVTKNIGVNNPNNTAIHFGTS